MRVKRKIRGEKGFLGGFDKPSKLKPSKEVFQQGKIGIIRKKVSTF
jgi:hypothetical protein